MRRLRKRDWKRRRKRQMQLANEAFLCQTSTFMKLDFVT
jgi:hypothetical protein